MSVNVFHFVLLCRSAREYVPGDKIFCKVRGFPHWPSRINLLPPDVPVPKGKYPIFFYGTHEVYFLTAKDIFPYEDYKGKYGKPKSRAHFNAGLEEIENNDKVLYYNVDPRAQSYLSRFYTFERTDGGGEEYEEPVKKQEKSVKKTPQKRPAKSSGQSSSKRAKMSNSDSESDRHSDSSHEEDDVEESDYEESNSDDETLNSIKKKQQQGKTPPAKPKSTPKPANNKSLPPKKRTSSVTKQKKPSEKSKKLNEEDSLSSLSSSDSDDEDPIKKRKDHMEERKKELEAKQREFEKTKEKEELAAVKRATKELKHQKSHNEDKLSSPTQRKKRDSGSSSVTKSRKFSGGGGTSTSESEAILTPSNNKKKTTENKAASGGAALNSMGRPVRESAKNFSAKDLVASGEFPLGTDDDEDVADSDYDAQLESKPLSSSPSANKPDSKQNNEASDMKKILLSSSGEEDETKKKIDHSDSTKELTTTQKKRLAAFKINSSSSDGDEDVDDNDAKEKKRKLKKKKNARPNSKTEQKGSGDAKSVEKVAVKTDSDNNKVADKKTVQSVISDDSDSSLDKGKEKTKRRKTEKSIAKKSDKSEVKKSSSEATKKKIVSSSSDEENQLEKLKEKKKLEKLNQKKRGKLQGGEITTEAKLRLINREIKASLIRGQEDYQHCLAQLEAVNKMEIKLNVLVKCWELMDTIKKCRRYKQSDDVKMGAQKVFYKFLEIYATADKDEVMRAQVEFLKHQNQQSRLASAGQSTNSCQSNMPHPTSIHDFFHTSGPVSAAKPQAVSAVGVTKYPPHVLPSTNETAAMVSSPSLNESHRKDSTAVSSSLPMLDPHQPQPHQQPDIKTDSPQIIGESVCSLSAQSEPSNPVTQMSTNPTPPAPVHSNTYEDILTEIPGFELAKSKLGLLPTASAGTDDSMSQLLSKSQQVLTAQPVATHWPKNPPPMPNRNRTASDADPLSFLESVDDLEIIDTYESNSEEEENGDDSSDRNQSDSLDLDSRIAQLMGNAGAPTSSTTATSNNHRKSGGNSTNHGGRSSTRGSIQLPSHHHHHQRTTGSHTHHHRNADNEEDEIYSMLGV